VDADLINALFEIAGAWCTWRNVAQLWRDKEVRGVYWPTTLLFTVWGGWNLVFYWNLGLPLSWWAGLVLILGNLVWVGGVVYWKRHKNTREVPPC
jgi:hypothetical protein